MGSSAQIDAHSRGWQRHASAVAITTALVIGARYLPFLDDPWDLTIGSINGAVYTAGIERTYQAVGFWRLRGMPHLQHLPSSPAAAWPNSHYINHPPLFHWATHVSVSLCGDTERGYRMLPVILTATAAVLLVMIVAYAGSRAATIAAALVTVTIPVNFLQAVAQQTRQLLSPSWYYR